MKLTKNKSVIFGASLFLVFITLSSATQSDIVLLEPDNFEHIKFGSIKPNKYTFEDRQLIIDVNNSASILMISFDAVKKINSVNFEWRSEGLPLIKSLQDEEKRSGDDAIFKLGLLLKTDESISNPFLRPWIKRVESLLKFPSDKMIYLVAGSKHAAGQQWVSPYNRRVTMVSINNVDAGNGWMNASYNIDQSLDVVALWLMADGDNTRSSFTTYIRNLKIE